MAMSDSPNTWHADFVAVCLMLWDRGHDTFDIASSVGADEADCERAVHVGLEQRRARNENQ